MPLVVALMCFAVDFMRVLYCEQQVEIATRALCDVESHLTPGKRASGENTGCPGRPAKAVVRKYLAGDPDSTNGLMKAGALTKEGLTLPKYVYCKGEVVQQSGLIHTAVNSIVSFVNGLDGKGGVWKILGKILTFVVELVTMRTQTYVTEVMPNDRIVRTSVSVKVQTCVPAGVYDFFGTRIGSSTYNWVCIPAYVPEFNAKNEAADVRTRYYCHLPVMETSPVAPKTYTRQLSKVLGKWVKLTD